MLFSALALIPLALSTVGAVAGSPNRAVHQSIAKRARNSTDISKRSYTDSRWSFYDVGLGACGKTNVNSDFIVALNQQQFGNSYPSPFCGKTITMNYQGKTATATIMDSCPGCPYGGLDLSRGLFNHFASEDTGIIYGEWSIAGEKPAAAVAAAPTPTTSPKPKPTPTTTKWTQPTTSEHTRVTTSKKPAPAPATTKTAPTTTWSPPPHDAVTTSTQHAAHSPAPSHKAAKASSSAAGSSSYAVASASSASLASSYASILPSASAAANSTGNGTVAEIQHNLDALGAILARLSTLIVNALPDDKE